MSLCPFNHKEIQPYRIHGLYPRGGMSGAGFSIWLNQDFANKIKQVKIECPINIIDMAKTIHHNLGFYEPRDGGLHFWEGTFLLHWCTIDVAACEIGIDGTDIDQMIYDEPLEYIPHNIDTSKQAYGLLSLWLHWFKYAEIILIRK